MQNKTTFLIDKPLSIRVQGLGEYVKQEIENLVDTFEAISREREEECRQEAELEAEEDKRSLAELVPQLMYD